MNLLELSEGLLCLDLDRRTYVALSHDGTYYHMIRPRQADEVASERIPPGDLICNCAGSQRHGNCYRLEQARAHERQLAEDAAWGLPSDLPKLEPVA